MSADFSNFLKFIMLVIIHIGIDLIFIERIYIID
jgi:hypothetical protein